MLISRTLLGSILCAALVGCTTAPTVGPTERANVTTASSPITIAPAADAPAVSVEATPVGTFPTRVKITDGQMAIGFDGTNFVSAWSDSRTAADGIYLARIRPTDGALLDPTGIALTDPPAPTLSLGLFQNPPERNRVVLAVGGGNTYVGWREYFEGSYERMIVARVDATGKVAARHSIDLIATSFLTKDGNTNWLPGVAGLSADSSGAAVFYYAQNPSGGFDVVARRIVGDTMSDPVTLLAGQTQYNGPIHVAMSQGALFVDFYREFVHENGSTWESAYAAIPAGGVALPVVHRTPREGAQSFTVFGVGGQFRLFVNIGDIFIAKIDGAGTVLSTSSTPTINGWSNVSETTVVDQFMVREQNPRCFQTIGGNGVKNGGCVEADADPEFPTWSFDLPPFATSGTSIAEAYFTGGSGNEFSPQIVKALVSSRGTGDPRAKVRLSSSANRQMFSSIATDGQTYVATWREDRTAVEQSGSLGAVFAARLDVDGKMVGNPIQLSSGPANLNGLLGGNAPSPRIIFDGTKYIAAWGQGLADSNDSDRVLSAYAAILPATGPLVAEKMLPIASSGGFGDVALGNDGKNTILAFTRSNGLFFEIAATRISNDTHDVLDAVPPTIAGSVGVRFGPSLAFNGKQTLIVWGGQEASSLVFLGAFLDVGEVVPKKNPFAIYNSGRFGLQPIVVSDKKHGFLVAWNEISTEDYQQNLFGKLVGDDGSLGAPDPISGKRNESVSSAIPLSKLGHDQRNHRIVDASDGSNYFITWSDGRRTPDYDVRGAWIDAATGKVHDPEGFPIAIQTGVHESTPAVAFRNSSEALVVYQEFSKEPSVNTFRLKARKIAASQLLGTACQTNDACASRACVDGVCCDTPCNDGCGVCNATPGTCTAKPSTATCGPSASYLCNGTSLSCILSCGSTIPCAPGSYCSNGQCEPIEAHCADDTTAEPSPGERVLCAPFKCLGNACLTSCGSVDDCATGLICDFSGRCVDPPAPPRPEEPSCAMGEGRASFSWFTGALSVFVIGASRVRRTKRTSNVDRSKGGAV